MTKGDRGMNSKESSFISNTVGELHPVGTPICKGCGEHLQELIQDAPPVGQADLSSGVSVSYQLSTADDTPQDKESSESSEHEAMQESEKSTASEELGGKMECLQIQD